MIHWYYNRHEDDERIDVINQVEEFIKKVIKHCPNENFKMVRFYGFYANSASKKYNMIKSFKRDPLLCSCGSQQTYVESYNPFEEGIKNNIQYKKNASTIPNTLNHTVNSKLQLMGDEFAEVDGELTCMCAGFSI